MTPVEAVDAPLSLLVFLLESERFGLKAEVVREVVRAVAVAPLPKAPAIVEGVINFRGSVVPVLDIRRRFGLPPKAVAPNQHLLIARAGPRVVALRVDRAIDLVSVPQDAIESASAAPGAEYVKGIAKLPDGLLVIHDLERFLSLDEAEKLDAAGASRGGRAPGGRKQR
ncbi:MAG: chemotaxis protein CheW [Gemmatimonadetes bacterium]|nr:chemotaxis protein CheW [Gemmatimonadota bacterium]